MVTPWILQGTPETGREVFRALYEIGPIVDTTAIISYPEWNIGGDPFCAHEGRKPAFAAGFATLETDSWRQIWNKYTEFQKRPGAQQSSILLEMYPMSEARLAGEGSASFAHRRTRFQSVILPWYQDSEMDDVAIKFGTEVRDLLRSSRSEKDVS